MSNVVCLAGEVKTLKCFWKEGLSGAYIRKSYWITWKLFPPLQKMKFEYL